VPSDHPFAKRNAVSFADVLDQEFVGLDRSSAIQRFLADKAARIGKPLKLRIQLRSFDAICRLVESNVGIGIVPQTTARRAGPTMAISAIPLADKWAVRELTICIRGMEQLPAYARQLVAHLRSDLQPEDLEG
jgi:DNA-binding transcriptional LysR family regulator